MEQQTSPDSWLEKLPERIGKTFGNWRVLEVLQPPTNSTRAVWKVECACGRYWRRHDADFAKIASCRPCFHCMAEQSEGRIVGESWVILGLAPKELKTGPKPEVLCRCIRCGADQVLDALRIFKRVPKDQERPPAPACFKCGGNGLQPRKLKKRAAGFNSEKEVSHHG